MSQLFRRLQNAPQVEKGQGLVEYALILVMVAVVVISILSIVGPSVGNIFSNIVDNLDGVSVAASGPQNGDICSYYSAANGRYQFRTYNNGWQENGQWDNNNHGRPTCT